MIGSAPTFSVSDFVAVFNQSLDMLFPEVTITGELSQFRISKGMWVYFDLKDEGASVKFFGTVRALPGPLEDGMLLEVVGRPYLHPKFGFSVQVQSVQATGDGSILKAQALLAARLEKEGLFDLARKRTLPYPPSKIGLIASVESAAYGDFTKIINERWPNLEIEVANVHVQGQDAPGQIIAAFTALNQKQDLEAIVMVRGGGSKDDLAAFDHEKVVRAVAASRIPTLVAIGHERDVCLSELAADVRASTPSNAAELLVPDIQAEISLLKQASKILHDAIESRAQLHRHQLETVVVRMKELLDDKRAQARHELGLNAQLLAALDPAQPLKRGYALIKNAEGQVVRSKKSLTSGGAVTISMNDGDVAAHID